MRYRILDNFRMPDAMAHHYKKVYWFNTSNNDKKYDYDYYDYYCPGERFRSMLDIVTPNFKKRSASGEVIINPLCENYYQRSFQRPTVKYRWKESFAENDEIHQPVIDPKKFFFWCDTNVSVNDNHVRSLFAEFDNTSSLATTAAWANVDQSEILALGTLCEGPETFRMIKQILYRAVTLIRNTRKTLASIKKANPSAVTDLWMEVRYGLRPLCFDMVGALKAFQKEIQRSMRQTARGHNTRRKTSNGTYIFHNAYNYYDLHISWTRTLEKTSRAGVLYSIDSHINGILSVWGIDQPLETIWELTPYSFVIDWFFNVGDIISSWSIAAGLNPLGSWVTNYYKVTENINSVTVTPGGYTFVNPPTVTGGSGTNVVQFRERIPNPSRAILPTLNLGLDTSKIIDLAIIGKNLIRL